MRGAVPPLPIRPHSVVLSLKKAQVLYLFLYIYIILFYYIIIYIGESVILKAPSGTSGMTGLIHTVIN
jgi:hypothetical protein